MFGRRIDDAATTPKDVAPPGSTRRPAPADRRGQRTIPVWLRPWLLPLIGVLAVIAAALLPVLAVVALLLVILAALLWFTRRRDLYERTRFDRFFRNRGL